MINYIKAWVTWQLWPYIICYFLFSFPTTRTLKLSCSNLVGWCLSPLYTSSSWSSSSLRRVLWLPATNPIGPWNRLSVWKTRRWACPCWRPCGSSLPTSRPPSTSGSWSLPDQNFENDLGKLSYLPGNVSIDIKVNWLALQELQQRYVYTNHGLMHNCFYLKHICSWQVQGSNFPKTTLRDLYGSIGTKW